MSMPVVHVMRSMDFQNSVYTLVVMSLCFVDGHCKGESHWKLPVSLRDRMVAKFFNNNNNNNCYN